MAENYAYLADKPRRLTDKEIGFGEQINPMTGLAGEVRPVRRLNDEEISGGFTSDTGGVSPLISTGSIRRYERILGEGNYHPEFGQDYVTGQLASRQRSSEQFLNFLGQAVIGEIGGGTIEGLGYLFDLDSYGKLLNNTEQEFGNWFSDLGKGLRTWTEDKMSVYRNPNAPKFDPGSWSWWMQNGKSVASTLSLMIPSAMAVRGLSAATKAIGAFQKIAPMIGWEAKGLTQAAISRHMENMMEAAGTYEEMYEKALSKGMSITDAQEYAAKAAAKTYKLDWAMYLQDVPQYLLLNTQFGKATGKMAEKSLGAAKAMGKPLTPIVMSKSSAILLDMLGEGFEEGYQYVAAEEAKYLTDKLQNPDLKTPFDERLGKYIRDGEFWTNVAMGALGAGVMQTAGRYVNELIQGGDQQLKLFKDFSTEVKHAAEQVRFADILGRESAKEQGLINLEAVMFSKGASISSLDSVEDMIKTVSELNPDDLARYDLTEEQASLIAENRERLLTDYEQFKNLWEKNATNPAYRINNKVPRITRAEFLIDKYNQARKNYSNKLNELESYMVNFDKLSDSAKEIFALSNQILSNKRFIEFQQKLLDNENIKLTKEQVNEKKLLIKVFNQRNVPLEKELAALEAERSKDENKDEKEADDKIDIGGPYNVSELKDIKDITGHSYMEYRNMKDAEMFASGIVDLYQKELEKIKAEKEKEPSKPEPEEDSIDLDDYVTYTKDGQTFTGRLDHIDDEGNYVIARTEPWEEGSVPTRATGELDIILRNDINKVIKAKYQYSEEDEQFEPTDIEDLVEGEEAEGGETIKTPQYMVKYYHKPTGEELAQLKIEGKEYVADNEELHQFLINSKGDLSGVLAEFYIDTESEYAKDWFKKNGFRVKKVEDISKGRVDVNYVEGILKKSKLVGEIPISIRLIKDGKALLSSNVGVYLHSTDQKDKYKNWDDYAIDHLYNLREKILKAVLIGDVAIANKLFLSNGVYNNTEDRGTVEDRLGLSVNDIVVGVSKMDGGVYLSNNSSVPGVDVKQPGTPFSYTKNTINGKKAWVKLNPTKLTREHAEILYDAIQYRYSRHKGALDEFPDKRVTGLNVGQVIQLLALFGEVKTNPDHPRHLTKFKHLRRNMLFVRSGRVLHFGTNKINLFEDNTDTARRNKEEFVQWATKDKNYSVPIASSLLGVGLNTPLNIPFKVGSWENKADGNGNFMTLAQFLASVPVDNKTGQTALVSDLNKSQPFLRPNLFFGNSINDVEVKVNPYKKKALKSPVNTKQNTVKKETTKKIIKNKELRNTQMFYNLPVGSVVYMEYPESISDAGEVIEAQRNPLGIIEVLDGKVILDLRYSLGEWNDKYNGITIRDTKGNPVKQTDPKNKEVVLLDEYLSKLKFRAKNNNAKIIVDVVGTVEETNVKAEEVESKVAPEEQKPEEEKDLNDTLNEMFGPDSIAMDINVSRSKNVIDLNKELDWLRKRFGKQNVKNTDKLIRIAGIDRLHFSIFTSDCIYVYTGAPEGALYHEAFHRVMLGYLSEDDRNKILLLARKEFNMPNATDAELNERLAEGFRFYKLDGTKPKSRTIGQFFKDLINFIYTFFTGRTRLSYADINRLYDSIERGQYRYSKISKDNFNKLKGVKVPMSVEIHRKEISSIDNHNDLKKVVNYLTEILITTNDIHDLNDIENIKMSKMFTYIDNQTKVLAKGIEETEKKITAGLVNPKDVEITLSISRKVHGIFRSVLDDEYRHLFVSRIADNLRRLNVKYILNEDAYLDLKESNDYKALYDKASYEVNLKDNMLASVKFLIATLHKSSQIDPDIGIREPVDFNEMWGSLMFNLYDIEDSDEMMDRIRELAKIHYPYQELLDKIVNDKTKYLKEQIRQSVQRHRHRFVNFLVNFGEDGKVENIDITDASTSRASKLLLSEWNSFFYSNNAYLKDNKYVEVNKESISTIVNNYNKLKSRVDKEMASKEKLADPNSYIASFTVLLNSLGIEVDDVTVTDYINKREGKNQSDKIFQTIKTDFGNIFNKLNELDSKGVSSAFSDEKHITRLAEEYVVHHPELMTDIVLGPSNSQYYVYSQNSYVSDVVRKINKNKDYLVNRLSKLYNGNSYYGEQLLASDKARKGLSVATFSMLGEYGSDGKNYLNVTEIEDYIFKVVAFRNNVIPFPTMADKSTYYLLRGVKSYEFDLVHEGDMLKFPEKALDILFGYAKSEKERIDEATKLKDKYDKAVRNKDKDAIDNVMSQAVENYHYVIHKGVVSFELGSAYLFHNFPSLNGRENLKMDDTVRQEIRKSVSENIRKELDYAESLGIITSIINQRTNKKIYKNVLLPKNILEVEVNKHGSVDSAIRNIISSFFVNNVISNVENEILFSGDPAFYKWDSETNSVKADEIKRKGVLSSTGDNFANYVKDHDIDNDSFNVATIETQKLTPSTHYYHLSNLHTKYNSDILAEQHPDWSKDQIKEEAKKITKDTLKPYEDVDPTDGQAWISPEMYRSLSIRLGEWSNDKQRAFELLQLDRELTLEEEKETLKVTFQPLKLVYFDLINDENLRLAIPTYHKASFATIFRAMGKGKYGDMQIIDVLDRMELKGKYANQKNMSKIDMLVMDSATKVGNRFKTKLFDDNLENINDLSNMFIYKQHYAGLRRQLVTDAHDADRTKTGTQFLKVALSNLQLNKNIYKLPGSNKEMSGADIVNETFNSLKALSNIGRDVLVKKLGYENGKVNKAKLIDLLREDARKSNSTDNLIDALSMMGDDMYLELDALTDHKWIQSKIIALISKHTVDVRLSGNQFIQFSNMGMRSINTKYTFEEEAKGKGKHVAWLEKSTDDLPFMLDREGNQVPMGCIVSINLFKHLIPNYKNLSFTEKIEFLKDNPEILGYRIPTQGQNSIFLLKVVGIYPETIGDTITLPSEFTSLTGSDFDIDKVYVVRYNYITSAKRKKIDKIKFLEGDTNDPEFLSKVYKNRYGSIIGAWNYFYKVTNPKDNPGLLEFTEDQRSVLSQIKELTDDIDIEDYIDELLAGNTYNATIYNYIRTMLLTDSTLKESKFVSENLGKSIYEVNSRKAVENRLLDTFFAVMSNKEHFKYTSAPLGGLKDRLQKLAEQVRSSRGKEELDLYFSSPRFGENSKYIYTGGKDGIGPFALNNVHHIFAQIAGLEMLRGLGGVMHETEDGRIDLSKTYDKYEAIPISAWLSALIDAHVDIAKDPFIMDLNVNSETYNVIALLIRGGVGFKAFEFLAQPILREMTRENMLGNRNNTLSKTFYIPKTTREGEIVRDDITGEIEYREADANAYVFNKWSSELSKKELAEIDKLSIAEIAKQVFESDLNSDLVKKGISNKEFVKRQLMIYKLYQELKSIGGSLNDLVQASQVDTKRFGTNAVEVRMFLNKLLKVYDPNNQAFTEESLHKILPYNPYTEEVYDVQGSNFLGNYIVNSVKLSLDILGDFSLYGTSIFNELFNKILLITQNKYERDTRLHSTISNEIFAVLASRFFTDEKFFAMDSTSIHNIMFFVPQMLHKIKGDRTGKYADLKNNAFINYLHSIPTQETELLPETMRSYVMVPIKSAKDKTSRDLLISSFNELVDHSDKEIADFARRLYLYSFFTSGLSSKIYSFHNLIPNELNKSIKKKDGTPISYNDSFMRSLLASMKDKSNMSLYNYVVDEVIMNNHYNNLLIRYVRNNYLYEKITSYNKVSYDRPVAVTLNSRGANRLYVGKNADGKLLYRKYIKIYDKKLGHIILRYAGYYQGMSADGSMVNTPVYITQAMRGYSNKGVTLKEYGMEKSIIEDYNKVGVIKASAEEEFIAQLAGDNPFSYVSSSEYIVSDETPVIGETTKQLSLFGTKPTEEKKEIKGPVGWSRFVATGTGYEVSTAGDERFSAFNATLKDGRTIEEAYQIGVKGYNTIQEGKGKPPKNNKTKEQAWEEYKALWVEWANDNPDLIAELRQRSNNKFLTDKFATSTTNQARALFEIINENLVEIKKGGEDYVQKTRTSERTREGEIEEFPFSTEGQGRVIFSTEPTEVGELVDEFGVKSSDDWTKLTAEQKRKLEDKYKHCIGLL